MVTKVRRSNDLEEVVCILCSTWMSIVSKSNSPGELKKSDFVKTTASEYCSRSFCLQVLLWRLMRCPFLCFDLFYMDVLFRVGTVCVKTCYNVTALHVSVCWQLESPWLVMIQKFTHRKTWYSDENEKFLKRILSCQGEKRFICLCCCREKLSFSIQDVMKYLYRFLR